MDNTVLLGLTSERIRYNMYVVQLQMYAMHCHDKR